jgi:hypothetical protein
LVCRVRRAADRARECVAVFGLNIVGVDLDRHGDCAVEIAGQSFAAVQAGFSAILDRLAAGDADRVALHLDLEIRFADPRQLGDDDDIVALAEYVERRISAAPARTRSQPPARAESVECLLELQEGVDRIGKQHSHG